MFESQRWFTNCFGINLDLEMQVDQYGVVASMRCYIARAEKPSIQEKTRFQIRLLQEKQFNLL